jgi:hypothetical protein
MSSNAGHTECKILVNLGLLVHIIIIIIIIFNYNSLVQINFLENL